MVSEHTYGDAVDIAMVNGIPIAGHQGAGTITDITERRIMTLQGSMQPNQLISLMTYPGVSYAWAQGDHADHIHVGFQPMFGDSSKLNAQYSSALKPGQWVKLIDRINHIGLEIKEARKDDGKAAFEAKLAALEKEKKENWERYLRTAAE